MPITSRAHPRWFPTLVIVGVLLQADVQGQDPSGLFELATYPVGSNPQGGSAADLDGDGDLDLVVANRFSSSLSVLWGDGSGAFGPATSLAVGSQPLAVTTGDFDGDGLIDLAAANAGSASISLLFGEGGGAFAPAQHVAMGGQPQDVAAADLDGDGRDELVIALDSASSPVSILWSSSPNAPVALDGGFCSSAVVLGDLDGDGLIDIVVNDCSFHAVRTYLNLGGGAMAASASWPVLLDPRDLALLDVDGDGALDVATVCLGADTVCVLRGAGDGSFASGGDFAAGASPVSIASGDFDADGAADLVSANFGSGDVSVLLGDGMGGFAAPDAYAAGFIPSRVVVADTSGEGVDDFVVFNAFSNDATVFTSTAEPPSVDIWVDLGGAVASRLGELVLEVEGDPVAGQAVVFTLRSSSRKTRRGWLIMGRDNLSRPFKGGVMVPSVDRRMKLRVNRPASIVWPDLEAGESLYFQAWTRLRARRGVAAGSNAWQGITQDP